MTGGRGRRVAAALGVDWLRSNLIRRYRAFTENIYVRASLPCYPELADLIARFRQSKSLGIDIGDAVLLYETILQRRPETILELGAGTSSNVIALAIHAANGIDRNYQPSFIAIEENPEFLRYHQETFVRELRRYCELRHSPARRATYDGADVVCYTDVPNLAWEFVHVDGPSNPNLGAKISVDALQIRLAERCCIIFDSREDTARFVSKRLPSFKSRRHPGVLNHILTR